MQTDEKPIAKVANCASCGAEIYWATTEYGANMPVDVKPDAGGNLVIEKNGVALIVRVLRRDASLFEAPRYHSHFVTCPNANQHRRSRATA